jgi:hypothetical protein
MSTMTVRLRRTVAAAAMLMASAAFAVPASGGTGGVTVRADQPAEQSPPPGDPVEAGPKSQPITVPY